MRDGISTRDLLKAADIADKHGLGVFVTGVRADSIQALASDGFVSEHGLGGVLQRVTGSNQPPRPMPANIYGNTAYGTMMSYKPRGFATPMFSRSTSGNEQKFQPLANQSTAKALNTTLVKYGLGQDWENAYEAVKLPDALSGIRQALQAAIGRDVRPIAPTADKFNIFNGVYIPSQPDAVYVNVASNVGFLNIAGHELWHLIKRQRPELIDWYRTQSRKFYKDLPAYRDRLNKLLQEGESEYNMDKAEEELEADFLGDSLTDVAFLQALADASPTKFKALLAQVRLWLAGALSRMKGLGSSKEVTDAKALQGYLKEVLVAFAEGNAMPAAPGSIAMSRGTNESTAPDSGGAVAQGAGLEAFSKMDDLYALPKSTAKDLKQIADDNGEKVTVRTTDLVGEKLHTLIFSDGTEIRVSDRKANPYGQDQQAYAFDLVDGTAVPTQIGRPGENPEDVAPTDDVWLDVSRNSPANLGAKAYSIAATFALNNGKIFIGDPAGLTDMALRRRTEQMLSHALKSGTTRHLAPHPRQVAGDAKLGVPPLKWVYGDHVGNIERMIDVSLKSLENGTPGAKDDTRYNPDTGEFQRKDGTVVSRFSTMGRSTERYATGLREAQAGWRTLARAAFLRSFLGPNGRAEGSGLLDRASADAAGLANSQTTGAPYPAQERVFYSRSSVVGKTNRQYTPGQLAAMKNVGFDVEPLTLKPYVKARAKEACSVPKT